MKVGLDSRSCNVHHARPRTRNVVWLERDVLSDSESRN